MFDIFAKEKKMKNIKTFTPVYWLSASARFCSALLLITLLAVILIKPSRATNGTHALFDLSTPVGGPFPSNVFTVPDSSQNTGLKVNLPKPDCKVRPSDCEDIDVINALDGFNLLPRLSVGFDGPIDLTTVTSRTVFLISLGSSLPDGNPSGRIVGINRVVWDPPTKTLHAESDELLDQSTRYALIVTNGIRDVQGCPLEAADDFIQFRHNLNFGQTHDRNMKNYRKMLLNALKTARAAGISEDEIVTASVFTTQSATVVLEKIRDQIKSGTPAAADFKLDPAGTRTVFPLSNVRSFSFSPQIRQNPTSLGMPITLPVSLLQFIPGAVGQIAFGKYQSPQYIVHPGEYIPAVATRTGVPQVQETVEVFFNLIVPAGTPPAGGWPVAIFGHGSPTNKNNQPLEVAAVMASHGIATIAINFVGNGLGPLGTLTISQVSGSPVTFPAGGRGVDQNHDNLIDEGEGRSAASQWSIVANRDTGIQTVIDFMQLVRVIEVGMDLDGDGLRDLDPSRIYFFGHSAGGTIGPMFLAIEPSVHAGVFNAIATPFDGLRLSPVFRPGVGRLLASRGLLNVPGLTQIGGVNTTAPFFNENLPLRNEPPLVNTVVGAMKIQESLDYMKWAGQSASSLTYAPYLRKQPLMGMSAKEVIIQLATGDQRAVNMGTTAILRAGDLADRATYIRNDLAYDENHAVPKDPHLLIRSITVPSVAPIARRLQEQIAVFFASDGVLTIHPEPIRFFEVPIASPLPEVFNFIP